MLGAFDNHYVSYTCLDVRPFTVSAYTNTIFDWVVNFKTVHCPKISNIYGQY